MGPCLSINAMVIIIRYFYFSAVVKKTWRRIPPFHIRMSPINPKLKLILKKITTFLNNSRYVPPLQSLPADFPETANEISEELRKQESLLNQIHAEMHAGFITTARDQQLWEAQRIVTQLKVVIYCYCPAELEAVVVQW